MEALNVFRKERMRFISTSTNVVTSVIGILGLLYILFTREATPLRSVPGPFLASITKLWVFKKQREFKRPFVDIALHQKYGPIVRIAPNEVLVSSPKSFRIIYGTSLLSPNCQLEQITNFFQEREVNSERAIGILRQAIVDGLALILSDFSLSRTWRSIEFKDASLDLLIQQTP
jgi:hypothetical protein